MTDTLPAATHPNHPAARILAGAWSVLANAIALAAVLTLAWIWVWQDGHDTPVTTVIGVVAAVGLLVPLSWTVLVCAALTEAETRTCNRHERYAWAAVPPEPFPWWAVGYHGLLAVAMVAVGTVGPRWTAFVALVGLTVTTVTLHRHARKQYRELQLLMPDEPTMREVRDLAWEYALLGPSLPRELHVYDARHLFIAPVDTTKIPPDQPDYDRIVAAMRSFSGEDIRGLNPTATPDGLDPEDRTWNLDTTLENR